MAQGNKTDFNAAPFAPTATKVATVASSSDRAPPREGTRAALLVELLSRQDGASVPDVMERTGWLPHTTRAALTGLRKRGYSVLRQADGDGVSRYRIAVEAPKPARKARGRVARREGASVTA